MRVLVLFGTTDGHAGLIACRVADAIRAAGHAVTVRSVLEPGAGDEIARSDAILVGGSVRYGRFPKALVRFVRHHAAEIASFPNAFFSVSMSARAGGNLAEVAKYLEDFRSRTGWHPRECASFAGALLYSRYNPFLRFVMRRISRSTGADTDTSRDYTYTDWAAVERFAARFAASLALPAAA